MKEIKKKTLTESINQCNKSLRRTFIHDESGENIELITIFDTFLINSKRN